MGKIDMPRRGLAAFLSLLKEPAPKLVPVEVRSQPHGDAVRRPRHRLRTILAVSPQHRTETRSW
jgi:hypothetical protein